MTTYVSSSRFVGLIYHRRGTRKVWSRATWYSYQGSLEGDLLTDDLIVVHPSEVLRRVALPLPEEISGMLGYRDQREIDRAHEAIAHQHGIEWIH
jgi:hypothetical protein